MLLWQLNMPVRHINNGMSVRLHSQARTGRACAFDPLCDVVVLCGVVVQVSSECGDSPLPILPRLLRLISFSTSLRRGGMTLFRSSALAVPVSINLPSGAVSLSMVISASQRLSRLLVEASPEPAIDPLLLFGLLRGFGIGNDLPAVHGPAHQQAGGDQHEILDDVLPF